MKEKRPLSLLGFLLCKEGYEERAEDVDYCLLLLVEVQPPKEVEDTPSCL